MALNRDGRYVSLEDDADPSQHSPAASPINYEHAIDLDGASDNANPLADLDLGSDEEQLDDKRAFIALFALLTRLSHSYGGRR
jgi:hypothetical protein